MTTESEREHGTYAGFQQHMRAGEEACESCRLARNEYARGLRFENPEILHKQQMRVRARNRALSRLAEKHTSEFAQMLKIELMKVKVEEIIADHQKGESPSG